MSEQLNLSHFEYVLSPLERGTFSQFSWYNHCPYYPLPWLDEAQSPDQFQCQIKRIKPDKACDHMASIQVCFYCYQTRAFTRIVLCNQVFSLGEYLDSCVIIFKREDTTNPLNYQWVNHTLSSQTRSYGFFPQSERLVPFVPRACWGHRGKGCEYVSLRMVMVTDVARRMVGYL